MRLPIATGTVDTTRACFERADGSTVPLTHREVALLRFLATRPGEDVSRDDLLVEVWGHHAPSLSRAVDTAVTRLRRRLGDDAKAPRVLCTAHGEGYRLVIDGPRPPAPVARSRRVDLGDRAIDLTEGHVRRGRQTIPLTSQERRLLLALADPLGAVLDVATLARRAEVAGGQPSLFNAIHRLRTKLEDDPSDPRLLVCVRGRGYRLAVPSPRGGMQELQETLWAIAEQLGRLLGLEDCVVYTRDGDSLVQAAAFGSKAPTRGHVVSPLALRIGEGIVGAAARTAAVQRVADVRRDRRYVFDLAPAGSELAVPVLHDGVLVGVIDSESPRVAAYDEGHQATFEAFGAIASAAMADLSLAAA